MHWPFGTGCDLVTFFSASNYSGKMQNHGAFALLGSTSDAAAAAAAARGIAASVAAEEASASEAAAWQLQTDEVDTPPTPMWTVRPGTQPLPFPLRALYPCTLSPLHAVHPCACCASEPPLLPLLRLWTSSPPSPEQVTGDADKEPTVSHTAPSAPSYSASVSMLSSTSSTSFSAMDEQSDGPQADLPSAPGFFLCLHPQLSPSSPSPTPPSSPTPTPCSSSGVARGTASARVHGGSRLRTFLPLARARRYRAEQGMTRPAEGTGAGALPEEGVLPMRTVERICQIMAKHFGEEAALCADVATLMGVLGTLGAEFTAAGEVSIARLAEQFALVPQPGDERPGLLSLLHRLNRHYIQALGEGASTVGNADEFPRSSSC